MQGDKVLVHFAEAAYVLFRTHLAWIHATMPDNSADFTVPQQKWIVKNSEDVCPKIDVGILLFFTLYYA